MFGLGTSELVLILLVVLILFGPNRLPELARGIGKMIHELRHSSTQLKNEIEKEAQREDSSPSKHRPS